eukprot:TRINITY_DN60328_c0_g1_i1.p1 TRINITY_DN60328_c0_g1~~TRINITY_DN60328_c0_g1_i1.p1  ORF type:complete len:828 (+),score=353.33 TRINITY_DN60328_c0_g1_i1:356-2485(+)
MAADERFVDKQTGRPLVQFDRVVFNFPHPGGKNKMAANRALLGAFLANAKVLLKRSLPRTQTAVDEPRDAAAQIHVVLKQYQGVDGIDRDPGHPGNTWQVCEVAAPHGIVLTDTRFWPRAFFKHYQSTGYRGGDDWFHTSTALLHVLELDYSQDPTLRIDRLPMPSAAPVAKGTLMYVDGGQLRHGMQATDEAYTGPAKAADDDEIKVEDGASNDMRRMPPKLFSPSRDYVNELVQLHQVPNNPVWLVYNRILASVKECCSGAGVAVRVYDDVDPVVSRRAPPAAVQQDQVVLPSKDSDAEGKKSDETDQGTQVKAVRDIAAMRQVQEDEREAKRNELRRLQELVPRRGDRDAHKPNMPFLYYREHAVLREYAAPAISGTPSMLLPVRVGTHTRDSVSGDLMLRWTLDDDVERLARQTSTDSLVVAGPVYRSAPLRSVLNPVVAGHCAPIVHDMHIVLRSDAVLEALTSDIGSYVTGNASLWRVESRRAASGGVSHHVRLCLESVAMVVLGIKDIRIMWSRDERMYARFVELGRASYSRVEKERQIAARRMKEAAALAAASAQSSSKEGNSKKKGQRQSRVHMSMPNKRRMLPPPEIPFRWQYDQMWCLEPFRPLNNYPVSFTMIASMWCDHGRPAHVHDALDACLFAIPQIYSISNLSIMREFVRPSDGRVSRNFKITFQSYDLAIDRNALYHTPEYTLALYFRAARH